MEAKDIWKQDRSFWKEIVMEDLLSREVEYNVEYKV